MIRCWLNPSLAPHYERSDVSFSERVLGFVIYVLPLGSIIFSVLGLMILGLATPTEAAASGALVTLVVAACYGKLTKKMVMDSTYRDTGNHHHGFHDHRRVEYISAAFLLIPEQPQVWWPLSKDYKCPP